ncbi:hypothetical protein LAJ19_19295 (plasmid) [Deinococcus taeanensis]|uniref:hypothetical protein n=1 Tax=Deinococcus taeanensis TaxID=2737050 RepID=UPI001CDC7AB5|nr:hypothetical protein [Deinococcus taeanensis]UBV44935.1 hypothetical protein LAJ19_19295 [Deinococcus taeanensis]
MMVALSLLALGATFSGRSCTPPRFDKIGGATAGLIMHTTHLMDDPGVLILPVLINPGHTGPAPCALALNRRRMHPAISPYRNRTS